MDGTELDQVLRAATAAVEHARDVRAAHRKKTLKGNGRREADIQYALNRIRRVMAPIRSELARMQYQRPEVMNVVAAPWLRKHDALKEASAAMQSERRKLWKMQDRKRAVKRGKRGTRR